MYMKSVFVAGSRKFFDEINTFIDQARSQDILIYTADKPNANLTPESEKKALLRAFQRINSCDIVFVFAEQGYVGETVKAEIAYALNLGKKVIVSTSLPEPFSVVQVIKPNAFIDLIVRDLI